MVARVFGFGTPLDYEGAAKGMLACAKPSASEEYFGVITKVRDDKALVVLTSADGGRVPDLIHLTSLHNTLWKVPGDLEVEPASARMGFGELGSSSDGLYLDADGTLFAGMLKTDEWGQRVRLVIDLSTGEHGEPKRPVSRIDGFSLFVRQEGREERWRWSSLTLER